MDLAQQIIKGMKTELAGLSRADKRDFNNALASTKWFIAYPMCSAPNGDFDQIYFIFSNNTPQERLRDHPCGIDEFGYDCDLSYTSNWKEIAVHMPGAIWISTKLIPEALIEPAPFSKLLEAECIEIADNVLMHQAITSFLGCGEDYDVDAVLDEFLPTVQELRLEVVYRDLEPNYSWAPQYGVKTIVIYYKDEVIGFLSMSGRELLSHSYFTQDIKKYQAALKDLVDRSGVYDKMVFDGVTVVSDEDADIFLAVPGITPKRYDE